MHIYGFQRVKKGVDKNCYFHKYFIRGQRNLLPKITRCPVKSGNSSTLEATGPDPDFYSLVAASTQVTSQLVQGDSSRTSTGNNSNGPLASLLVSDYILNNSADARNARHHGTGRLESVALTQRPPPVEPNISAATAMSAISSLLERLQAVSTSPHATIPTQNNNPNAVSSAQSQPDELGNITSLTTTPFSQREANISAMIAEQAERNRLQLQFLINQSQAAELLRQQQQQQQEQTERSARDLLLLAEGRATTFFDELRRQQGPASSDSQIVQNAIAVAGIAASSTASVQPPPPPGGLSIVDNASDHPIIQYLKSQIGAATTAMTSNTTTSAETAANLQSMSSALLVEIRNQQWNQAESARGNGTN